MSDEDRAARHGYRLVKPAATGKERADAIARMEAISRTVGARVAREGLSEEELAERLDED